MISTASCPQHKTIGVGGSQLVNKTLPAGLWLQKLPSSLQPAAACKYPCKPGGEVRRRQQQQQQQQQHTLLEPPSPSTWARAMSTALACSLIKLWGMTEHLVEKNLEKLGVKNQAL